MLLNFFFGRIASLLLRSFNLDAKWVINLILEGILSFEKYDYFDLILWDLWNILRRIMVSLLKFRLWWWVTLWLIHPSFCFQNALTFLLFGFHNLTNLQTQFKNSFKFDLETFTCCLLFGNNEYMLNYKIGN